MSETGTGFVRRLAPVRRDDDRHGGIIGSGIFMNPSVVARLVHTPFLILGAWIFGGCIALGEIHPRRALGAGPPSVDSMLTCVKRSIR